MKFKFFLIMFALTVSSSYALDIKVISYNIRFNNPDDGVNAWPNRKDEVVKLLRFHEAGIFGLQEALLGQINDIAAWMPGFDWVGVGRDDGINRGEFSPIFYNSKRYQLKEHGWFWLSETPTVPSKSWDAALPRICTYVLLEDYETRKNFWVFNTHFDHVGEKARKEAAKLILKKIQDLNNDKLPVILTGDFNATPDDDPINVIERRMNDSKKESQTPPYGPDGTFNGFDFNSPLENRIDFIFVNRKVIVKKYAVLSDSNNQRYPSDHLPVFTELSF
ncbi:MAG: endonuclease/exonuclease/phosphatase family protein [Mangrovibacterium sp.]